MGQGESARAHRCEEEEPGTSARHVETHTRGTVTRLSLKVLLTSPQRIEEWYNNYHKRVNKKVVRGGGGGLDMWNKTDMKQPPWQYYAKLYPAKVAAALDYEGYKKREIPKLKPGKNVPPFVAYRNKVAEKLFEEETDAIRKIVMDTKHLRELRLEELAAIGPLVSNSDAQKLGVEVPEDEGTLADDEDGVLGQPRRSATRAASDAVTDASRNGPDANNIGTGALFTLTTMSGCTYCVPSSSLRPSGRHESHTGGKGG